MTLESALKQATEYANLLEVSLIFAMNGTHCESRFVNNNKELILNDEEVRELIREKEALQFLKENTNEIYTIPQQVIISRGELIRIFKDLNDILRNEGIRLGMDRFSEFANFLFLKLLSENEKESYWEDIKKIPNERLVQTINNVIIKEVEYKYGGNVFNPIAIKNYSTLRHIISALDPLVLSTIDTDIKGDAFEYFLKQTTASNNDLGEYFTPRHIVKTIIKLVSPKFKETIYDPFCGTGGFLTGAFNYIKENNIIKDPDDLDFLQNKTLFGGELTNTSRIAKMNMILHGDGHSGVKQIDSLANPDWIEKIKIKNENGKEVEKEVIKKFDMVVTNIPFSQKITKKIKEKEKTKIQNTVSPLYYNGIAKNSGDCVCILHCLRALKEGGRMALIVPEGFLFRNAYKNVRKFLLDSLKLQIVISLPRGTFLPYTPSQTFILYFTDAHKTNSQKRYWYFNVNNDGYSLDNHRRKLTGKNDLHKIVESNVKEAEKDCLTKESLLEIGFEVRDLQMVKDNNYNLMEKIIIYDSYNYKHQLVQLKDVIIDIKDGGTPSRKSKKSNDYFGGNINWCVVNDIKPEIYETKEKLTELGLQNCSAKVWPVDSIIISLGATIGNVGIAKKPTSTKQGLSGIIVDKSKIHSLYLYYILTSRKEEIQSLSAGTSFKEVRPSKLIQRLYIPLPSLQEQRRIINELDSYKNIVKSTSEAVYAYKPFFKKEENWSLKKIQDVCDIEPKKPVLNKEMEVSFIPMVDVPIRGYKFLHSKIKTVREVEKGYTYFIENDVLLAKITPCFENGKCGIATNLNL